MPLMHTGRKMRHQPAQAKGLKGRASAKAANPRWATAHARPSAPARGRDRFDLVSSGDLDDHC